MLSAIPNVPRPTEPGTDGTQQTGKLEPDVPRAALSGEILPESEFFTQLAATHANRLGGEVQARLLARIVENLEREKSKCELRCDALAAELRVAIAEKHSFDIDNARLSAQLAHSQSEAMKKAAAAFIGTTLFGLALEVHNARIDNSTGIAYAIAALGAITFIYAIWWKPRSRASA